MEGCVKMFSDQELYTIEIVDMYLPKCITSQSQQYNNRVLKTEMESQFGNVLYCNFHNYKNILAIYIYTYLKTISGCNIIWIPKYLPVCFFNKLIIENWVTNPKCHMNTEQLNSELKVRISVF